MAMERREFLRSMLLAFVGLAGAPFAALAAEAEAGNFARVYSDAALRDRFFLFLQNVFHLYPEARLHQLIIDVTAQHTTDEAIYSALLVELPRIKPWFADLTYGVPALAKQKREMTRQTLEFVPEGSKVDGILEIGSTGRYVSAFKGEVERSGPLYLINDARPSYSPVDLIERERIPKLGRFIPLGNYDAFGSDAIPDASLDLVTNFIGFHHCPTEQLDAFVASIHRALRPGGRLLLRDHDVDSPAQGALVGLAHDVFNAGFGLSWDENHQQIRLFRSLDDWTAYLKNAGFEPSTPRLAQPHDPTQNLLVELVKV